LPFVGEQEIYETKKRPWRRRPESNRCTRICNPEHSIDSERLLGKHPTYVHDEQSKVCERIVNENAAPDVPRNGASTTSEKPINCDENYPVDLLSARLKWNDARDAEPFEYRRSDGSVIGFPASRSGLIAWADVPDTGPDLRLEVRLVSVSPALYSSREKLPDPFARDALENSDIRQRLWECWSAASDDMKASFAERVAAPFLEGKAVAA